MPQLVGGDVLGELLPRALVVSRGGWVRFVGIIGWTGFNMAATDEVEAGSGGALVALGAVQSSVWLSLLSPWF